MQTFGVVHATFFALLFLQEKRTEKVVSFARKIGRVHWASGNKRKIGWLWAR